jgi:hypothetical protein
MNPNFPATPYPGTVIAAITDETARQYLDYDSWLYHERVRNWTAYASYVQQKKKQDDLRIRVLHQMYQNSMAQFYEYQRQALEAQKQQQQEQEQDKADMESYLKEIEEQRQQQDREAAQANLEQQNTEDDAEEWYRAGEEFARICRAEELREAKDARRERRRLARQDKRRYLAATKNANIEETHNEPLEAEEVSRAENYNANKASRNVRYIGADKRKGQKFQARRQFGSGWGKRLE